MIIVNALPGLGKKTAEQKWPDQVINLEWVVDRQFKGDSDRLLSSPREWLQYAEGKNFVLSDVDMSPISDRIPMVLVTMKAEDYRNRLQLLNQSLSEEDQYDVDFLLTKMVTNNLKSLRYKYAAVIILKADEYLSDYLQDYIYDV